MFALFLGDCAWIILAVFSYRWALLCWLRKLVQNGRHVCRFVHTTDLEKYKILPPCFTTGAAIKV